MVFVFYNDGIFKGILKLLEELNISAWEWIEAIYNEPVFGKLKELVNEFIEDTRNELWKSEEELLDFIQKDGSIDAYINDELGSNIIFKYKLLILIEALKEVAQLAKKVTLDLIASKGHSSEELNQLVEEIVLYHYAKANKILTCEGTEYYADFKTNIWPFVTAQADKAEATESAQKDTPYHTDDVKLGASYHEYEGDDELNRGLGRRESNRLGISGESENTLRFSPGRLVFAEPKKIEFYHDETQQESLTSFKNRYGSGGIPALTRVLAKVYFGKAFRKSREIKAPNDIRPDSVRLEAP